MKSKLSQYQIIRLTRDINPILKSGMTGVILEIWDDETFEAEFLDKDGINYTFEQKTTFTLKLSDVQLITE